MYINFTMVSFSFLISIPKHNYILIKIIINVKVKNNHDNILLLSNRYDGTLLNSTIKNVRSLFYAPYLVFYWAMSTDIKTYCRWKNTQNVFYGTAISYIDDNKCLNNHY